MYRKVDRHKPETKDHSHQSAPEDNWLLVARSYHRRGMPQLRVRGQIPFPPAV